ncbi:MAG: hypothetical protein HYY33_06050 [Chloroflexi bacterium]|nr:hypothetical protein [Chloroflexota bacterium]
MSVPNDDPVLGSAIRIRGEGGAPVNVFELTNSDLTSSSAPLFSVNGPNAGGGANLTLDINTLLAMDPSTLILGGSLLSLSSATLTSTGPVFSLVDSTIEPVAGPPPPSVPLISLSSAALNVTGAGQSILSLNNSSVEVPGPFIDSTNSNITVSGPVVLLQNGSTLTNTAGPAIRLNGGSLTADALGISSGTGNQVNLTGSLLDLTTATVTLRTIGDDLPGANTTVTYTLGTGVPVPKGDDMGAVVGVPRVKVDAGGAGVAVSLR